MVYRLCSNPMKAYDLGKVVFYPREASCQLSPKWLNLVLGIIQDERVRKTNEEKILAR